MSRDINEKIITYLKRYDPKRIGVFGSYAREEDTPQSDIVTGRSLNDRIKDYVYRDLKIIFG